MNTRRLFVPVDFLGALVTNLLSLLEVRNWGLYLSRWSLDRHPPADGLCTDTLNPIKPLFGSVYSSLEQWLVMI